MEILAVGLLGLFLLGLHLGPMPISPAEVLSVLAHKLSLGFWPGSVDAGAMAVVWELRLPRILVALGVGAALASAGACLQGLFRNPLADPGLIGVSSGGAIGAILAIGVVGTGSGAFLAPLLTPAMAMTGSLAATILVYRIARIAGKTHVSTLLLAGIAINAFAGSIVGSILYLSDDEALRQFTFWTLGSLHGASWKSFWLMLPFIAGALLVLPRYRRALNAFLLGEAEAYHLGFDVQRIKRIVILLCAVMVGVTVAFSGLIGFVGLVVPHLSRLIWGPDFRHLLPASALLGATLLLAADLVARTVNAPSEIPIGIVTSLIGAPFFLYLIQQRKRQVTV
jgi:iron complex transport system permease protein